jgi:hypothetical protein
VNDADIKQALDAALSAAREWAYEVAALQATSRRAISRTVNGGVRRLEADIRKLLRLIGKLERSIKP